MAIKKTFCIFFVVLLVFSLSVPAFAAPSDGELIFTYSSSFDDYELVFFPDIPFVDGHEYYLSISSDNSTLGFSSFASLESQEIDGVSFSVFLFQSEGFKFLYSPYFSEVGSSIANLIIYDESFYNSFITFSVYDLSGGSSSSFVDRVSDGIGSVLSWLRILFSSLLSSSGSLYPLFQLLVVGISVTLILFIVKIIRLFIWGY